MPRVPNTLDDVLFAPLSPSALARGEHEVARDAASARELAEGRVALEALARSIEAHEPVDSDESAPSARDLRARLMASFGRSGKYGIFADRLARLFDISLEAAMKLIARVEDPTQLKPGPAEGIMWITVRPGPAYANAWGAIGRLAPGSRFPHHEHVGTETTLVLDGGFRDVTGEEVWRGDELIKEAGSAHDFVILEGVDCIAAVLAQGGVKF